MATLEITTLIGCPLACTFCPQDSLSRAFGNLTDKRLSLENFILVLEKLPTHVAIHFSGMSEPFANDECIDMVMAASKKSNPISIYTTLVGLRPADTNKLVALIKQGRFTNFVIHLPDAAGNMRGFKITDDYMYAAENLIPLDETKTMTMSSNAKISVEFMQWVNSLSNNMRIKEKLPRDKFVGWRRAGSLTTSFIGGQEIEEECNWQCAVSCQSTPFYDHNVMLPDGRVVLCCMDYGLKHTIANLFTDEYADLFSSDQMDIVRYANMSLDSAIKSQSICTQCSNVCTYQSLDGIWTSDSIYRSKVDRLISALKRLIRAKI